MDLDGILLSEISQTEKNKDSMISLLCESEKCNKLVNKTKEKQTHRYRDQTSGERKGRGARQG